MLRLCLLGPLVFAAIGCGGSRAGTSIGNAPDASVRITVKADAGRTNAIGYRIDDEPVELETRIRIDGANDSSVTATYPIGGPPPMLHVRGFDVQNAVVWIRDVQLAGTADEPVTVDPNEG